MDNTELAINSALGAGKMSISFYKGFTPTMKQAIYGEQANQRAALKVFHLRRIKKRLDSILKKMAIPHFRL